MGSKRIATYGFKRISERFRARIVELAKWLAEREGGRRYHGLDREATGVGS